jgi:glycosyltransferase involved in cell wall biosynthesis
MNKTKNICLFNSSITWGGGEKWHHVIALELKNSGYNVIVCTNIISELNNKLSDKNITLFRLRVKNLSFLNPFLIYKAYRIFKRNNIDTVIFGLPSDVKSGGIAAKLAGVRKIIYRRGTALPVKNSLINRFLYKYVITDVIANSIEIKNKFLERNANLCPVEHLHIIYNGVETNHPNSIKLLPKQGHQLVLGNAGRLVEQKGQKYLIELAVILKRNQIDFKILIAGKGELENSLKKYAKQHNVDKNISFLGFVEDMNGFFNSIDLFLLTSIHEGSANIILEAMSFGKPVIGFNISSMSELVDNEKSGYLVKFGDMEAYAKQILYLNNHPSICNQMSKNALDIIQSRFTIDNCMQQLENIIQPLGFISTDDFAKKTSPKNRVEKISEPFSIL